MFLAAEPCLQAHTAGTFYDEEEQMNEQVAEVRAREGIYWGDFLNIGKMSKVSL